MRTVVTYWPVLARYALMIATGYLVRAGLVPEDVGEELARDPEMQMLIAAAFTAAAGGIWYLWSKSKAALKDLFDRNGGAT